ncbi:hypothetical protein [Gryllotalpicola koreensis]|uniref:Major capsid protein n=1 Tax=Gryllotalpicola koreensis TaxID=993086 RepID=A0ABP7ZUL7_9MICO
MTTELGAFTVDATARVVRGILLPFGETSRLSMTRNAPISFTADAIELPADPTVVTLNRDHDQFSPIGRAQYLEKRREGVYAEFSIARTPEGDAWLADYAAGKFKKLSAEVRDIVRDAADAAHAIFAKLTGAATVSEGAFASAALFAIDDGSAEESLSAATPAPLEPDEDGDVSISVTDTPATVTVTDQANTQTVFTPRADDTEGDTMANATAPTTLAASAANLVTAGGEGTDRAARDVFSLIANAQKGDHDAEQMLAALTDIKTTGAGQLPVGGSVIQPSWLGEVWKQKTYQRRYMSLIRNGSIVSQDEKGYTVTAGTEPVQPWAGNKSAVPSSSGTTTPVSSIFQRWAWAADIAREFFDIPGNTEVIEAFLRLVNNSYARQTDKWTLAQLVASATTVAPEAYPTVNEYRDYPSTIKQIIQGVDYISAEPVDDTPAFVVANAKAWQDIIYTPKDALPQWLTLDFGIPTQDGNVGGSIKVVRGDLGIEDTPAVLVGAYDSAHVNELGGASPLNLNALDIVNGGIDRGVIGYTQFMADYAAALVIIGAADA